MRGTIKHYDTARQSGTIQSSQGDTFQFGAGDLVSWTRAPRIEAQVVFRVVGSRAARILVVSYKRQWAWLAVIGEILVTLPFALSI